MSDLGTTFAEACRSAQQAALAIADAMADMPRESLPETPLIDAFDSVRGEIGMHLPELRGDRADHIAECIVRRLVRDHGEIASR